MRIINDIKCIIIKKLSRSKIFNSERREIGLQLADFEERKQKQMRKQMRKQIRKQEYDQRIETDVWLG
jgi:hypothetical protein